jgi:threonine aldolase
MPSNSSRASRRLDHHPRQTVHDVLVDLAESVASDLDQDHYGDGDVIERLERRVADLLGKEAAVLMPSGTMAQQIALRIWCDRVGIHRVAFHPTCHLELHERGAYRELHGLSSALLGDPDRLFTIDDLQGLREPVAAILFELPQREIGGYLPEWNELAGMTDWAREHSIRLHLDGARLWETGPHYGREYAEITGLFDTVYVSFYKILGGIAGAALAGPADVIDTARLWLRRHGGNLVHMYPLAVSAELGLDRHLGKMGEYHEKALEIAAVLSSLPGVSVRPNPPHTNMMHVFIEGDLDRLKVAGRQIVEEADTELFGYLDETVVPGVNRFELTVGDSALGFGGDEVRQLFTRLLGLARV